MSQIIENAKADFVRSRRRLTQALATTPEDRVAWSPSATSRSPIHLVVHSAQAVKNLNLMMDGTPFPFSSTQEADVAFREWEKRFTTREQAQAELDEVSDAYEKWLDDLAPERLQEVKSFAFGGDIPVFLAITFPGMHMSGHASQIEYIQTIYGDHDWHM